MSSSSPNAAQRRAEGSGTAATASALRPARKADEIALVGSADRIRDRLQAWKDAGKQRHIDCMLLSGNANAEALRVIAEAPAREKAS
jgi:alkanesulfonate monooxygenase SsuD/methylene tetrahydromethanopterin reductase-like flavin-dependent oxidoreductase (luciferase family)